MFLFVSFVKHIRVQKNIRESKRKQNLFENQHEELNDFCENHFFVCHCNAKTSLQNKNDIIFFSKSLNLRAIGNGNLMKNQK